MKHLLLILLVCCSTNLLHAQAKKGAFFNPRISSRTIAFNQVLRVQFTTIPAQLPEVDVLTTVRSALELPSSREHWRLYGQPQVEVHERLKTITVSFALLPRHAGELPLPDVPVRWLDGDQVASFGAIAVGDEIMVGNQPRPIPLELSSVAGFPWETPFTQLRERLGEQKMQEFPAEERHVFRPNEQVTIECRSLMMHTVRLQTRGLTLEEARPQFIDRWGEPLYDRSKQDSASLVWVLGWLRITATEQQGENDRPLIMLELVREDVNDKILAKQLEDEVFDVLDGNVER